MIKAKTIEQNLINTFKKANEVYSQKEVTDKIINSKIITDEKNHPKELEYWKNIFPTKTDNELEEYRTRWGKENPKYLKFERLNG